MKCPNCGIVEMELVGVSVPVDIEEPIAHTYCCPHCNFEDVIYEG